MTIEEAIKRNPFNPNRGNKSAYCRYLRYNVTGWYNLDSKEVRRRWQKAGISMELDKEIERFENNAEFERRNGNLQGCLDFRQIAEWLRELKDIKHLFSITEKLFKACLRDDSKDIVDGHEILYSEHKQLREIFEEVNADDSN